MEGVDHDSLAEPARHRAGAPGGYPGPSSCPMGCGPILRAMPTDVKATLGGYEPAPCIVASESYSELRFFTFSAKITHLGDTLASFPGVCCHYCGPALIPPPSRPDFFEGPAFPANSTPVTIESSGWRRDYLPYNTARTYYAPGGVGLSGVVDAGYKIAVTDARFPGNGGIGRTVNRGERQPKAPAETGAIDTRA